MKYVVYVLVSQTKQVSYVGYTNNLERRLEEHNLGKNYFTKRYIPWEIRYTEEYNDALSAKKREKYLKSASGRKLVLKKLFD